jgi:hypothetical protein
LCLIRNSQNCSGMENGPRISIHNQRLPDLRSSVQIRGLFFTAIQYRFNNPIQIIVRHRRSRRQTEAPIKQILRYLSTNYSCLVCFLFCVFCASLRPLLICVICGPVIRSVPADISEAVVLINKCPLFVSGHGILVNSVLPVFKFCRICFISIN